ncbi:DUF4961 domain-containing protein [Fulvivirga ligni]|uniref:DUF4961 domain-containing protein n=1 Tax=Fulvivirga ligni TaxID=2904246 RepID=UPI001F36A304|nr:DUF4961 domain-containing protein [Fulvivirga ligni]UII19556.1 DUF4961 domain-containing protein [Fulvivirga ligni]
MKNLNVMKINLKLKRGWWHSKVAIVLLGIFMMTCVSFEGEVDHPESGKAGEEVTFTVHPFFDVADGRSGARMVIGFLAPKSWKAAQNTVVTYTSDLEEGMVGTMSLIPDNTLANWSDEGGGEKQTWKVALRNKYGVGPNVINDMEWIVYWSDKTYAVQNEEDIHIDVDLKVKLGAQNMRVRPMFVIAETEDGTRSGNYTDMLVTDCFEVTDGEGDVIDFCELHINSVQPVFSTKDDLVTFTYQGDIKDNDLQGADEVYLCATAYTDNGKVYEVCNREAKSAMKNPFRFGNTFELTMWPASYFGIAEDEIISSISYSFTSADGAIQIMDDLGDEDTNQPYSYALRCN